MKIENNKHVSSQFGMPRYTNLDYIKKVKYTRILFLRVNDSVIVSLTSDNDKRIKEWAKRATNKFSILLSTEVKNPIKTRKYFWDKRSGESLFRRVDGERQRNSDSLANVLYFACPRGEFIDGYCVRIG